MTIKYPTYQYSEEDARNKLASFVRLDNQESYPFDSFHAHNYNEIMVFLKGGGTHNINFRDYPIESGAIHLIAAHDLHWVERAMDSEGFAIVYKDQFLQKLQLVNSDIDFTGLFNHSRIINLEAAAIKQYNLIIGEMLDNKGQSAYMLQLIGAFITKIATRQFETQVLFRNYDPLVNRLVVLIEKNFKERLSTEDYAKLLHVSLRTLQYHVKKASGRSVPLLQKDRVLKEAKKMLCTTDLNVNEISMELGFTDAAYFCNWFKKATGVMPSAYKYGQ
ncbi:MAG: AraC family transcriptional regulator [Sphingobacteriales bacterium]|nr:MAG: AraC family transcriptional regulator [Sphingobacteriales bacterium]